jgi:hypothetical protein
MRFRTFVTPQFGVLLFWLCAVPLLFAAGFFVVNGQPVYSLICLAWVLFLRVILESLAILFQIHDVLVDIRDANKRSAKDAEREAKLARARELASRRPAAVTGENRLEP